MPFKALSTFIVTACGRAAQARLIILPLVISVCALLFPSFAFAASPGPDHHKTPTASLQGAVELNTFYKMYTSSWLKAKLNYKVRSGITKMTKKGEVIHQSISAIPDIPCCGGGGGYPTSDVLTVVTNSVDTVYEPSDGNHPNFGPGSSSRDDAGNSYNDLNFFGLCGPGAADIALEYWPAPPNLLNATTSDYSTSPHTITTWSAERMRGYMTWLAWTMPNFPSSWYPSGSDWPQVGGIMDQSHYTTWGVNNYEMADMLNWELTAHETTGSNFYIPVFWSDYNQSTLLANVESDIATNGVPVVANVDPYYLQASDGGNWPNGIGHLYHFITIVGYDNNAGIYYYTDTCGHSTNCGSSHDGGVNSVSQNQMWAAITGVPVDKGTNVENGNGGWIW
jgi:hypothetical protein